MLGSSLTGSIKLAWALLAAAALQGAVLVGGVAVHAAPLWLGETVRLKVIPVDPRDLFRGDYVTLAYDFTQFDQAAIAGLPTQRSSYDWSDEGREVYVRLKPADNGKHLVTKDVTVARPSSGPYLRGTLQGWRGVQCGIDAWYVQQGEGLKIEQAIRANRNVFVDVAVWGGQARLKNLVIE